MISTRDRFGALAASILALTAVGTPLAAGEREFKPRKVVSPFPAITDAPTLPAETIGDKVRDTELVLGVVVDGRARAYPINQLTQPTREIINDVLAGTAIAATW